MRLRNAINWLMNGLITGLAFLVGLSLYAVVLAVLLSLLLLWFFSDDVLEWLVQWLANRLGTARWVAFCLLWRWLLSSY